VTITLEALQCQRLQTVLELEVENGDCRYRGRQCGKIMTELYVYSQYIYSMFSDLFFRTLLNLKLLLILQKEYKFNHIQKHCVVI
jgi:hypothetical protein